MMTEVILVLGGAVALGVLLALVADQKLRNKPRYLLIFSGAYLLGIGVFHLLPEVYDQHSHHYGILIMAGFFVQLILEAFSKGLEHGHTHLDQETSSGTLPLGILISLFIHALLEGIPLGTPGDELSREALMWGLVVHKTPVTIILIGLLRNLQWRVWQIALALLIFAMMAPLGASLGSFWPGAQNFHSEITAFVFGIFLHISTTILFEADKGHRFHFIKFGIILLALAIAYISIAH